MSRSRLSQCRNDLHNKNIYISELVDEIDILESVIHNYENQNEIDTQPQGDR